MREHGKEAQKHERSANERARLASDRQAMISASDSPALHFKLRTFNSGEIL